MNRIMQNVILERAQAQPSDAKDPENKSCPQGIHYFFIMNPLDMLFSWIPTLASLRSAALWMTLLFLSFTAEAKWVDLSDASSETLLDNVDLKINKDGTSEEAVETRLKILNERGRSYAASYRMTYNGDISKLEIIDAYTIYQGEEHKVDLKKIEDKPLASSAQGFDQQRQVLISFPKAEIGAELYLKYTVKNFKTSLPNFYNDMFLFGDACASHAKLKVTSALPLYLEVNDPSGALKITQDKKDGFHKLEANLLKTICGETVEGSEIGNINSNKSTFIALSSLNDWNEYAKQSAVKYEQVINQPIPALFLPILEAASHEKNEYAQLNLVTSMINEKVRYMGNWGSIDGKFYPRDLEVIAKLQEADCKEFASLTAAILRKLGYKAQIVLITRNEGTMSLSRTIPNIYASNHAILQVTDKAGKKFLLDPTNLVSMAQGTFPDISNKMILVLDLKNPSYECGMGIDPKHAKVIFNENLDIKGDQVIHKGQLTLVGESALNLAGQGLYNSPEAIKDNMFQMLSNDNLPAANKKAMNLPSLSSRIVEDLKVTFEYNKDNDLIKTNLGSALELPASWSGVIINHVPGQLADLYIGPKHTLEKKTIINNIKVKEIENLNYEIDSKWVYIKRSCSIAGNNSEISDQVLFKKDFITSEELESKEYKDLKKGIEENIKNIAVLLH